MLVWIRSCLYWLGLAVITPLFFTLGLLAFPLPAMQRHRVITLWTPVMMWWLRLTCGLRYKVIGAENIPTTPSIIACKHQSGWETMALQLIFPQQVWVLKRELLWIPFFGWGLAMTSPIAIDRGDRVRAAQRLIDQGRERLKTGFWIVIFPEGTRIPPGQRGKYKQGAARLARDLETPLVPVALNAGEFWPRNSFRKYPGEITVVVGKPIVPAGQTPDQMTKELETWIEARQSEISGVGPCANTTSPAKPSH